MESPECGVVMTEHMTPDFDTTSLASVRFLDRIEKTSLLLPRKPLSIHR